MIMSWFAYSICCQWFSVSSYVQKPLVGSSGKASGVEFVTAAPEQPSPISVLDASFYQDDLLPFPSKKNFNTPQGMCLRFS